MHKCRIYNYTYFYPYFLDFNSDDTREASNKEEKNNSYRQRRLWTKEEKFAVEKHFLSTILRGKLPGAGAIKQCLSEEPVLSNRNWRNVKDFCRNRITSMEKKKPNSMK